MEDLRLQLQRVFAAELAEHVATLRAGLAVAEAGGAADLRDLFRRAHSIKGAARATDLPDVEALAHALESLLEQAEAVGRIGPAGIADARATIDAIEDAADTPADAGEPPLPGAPAADPAEESGDDLIRIPARYLDRLTESLRLLQEELDFRNAIAGNLRATRGELDAIGRACLEPGATLPQIAARVRRLHRASLDIATRRMEADDRVARAIVTTERDAERILLVPASGLAAGLERMVREVARDAGREARLTVEDDGAEADRRIVQRLRDPITQILRNAIGHGIEPPEQRIGAGKPAEGHIRLSIRAARGSLSVMIEDDGAGPDLPAIRAAVERRGLVEPGAWIDEAGLLALLFEHGVSTAGEAGRLSGRGVGLSVVADAVRRLGGTVRLARAAGGGTRLAIAVPLAITRRAVLLVEAGGQVLGLPSSAVGQLLRIDPAAIAPVEGVPSLIVATQRGERPVPVVPLAGLLGLPVEPATGLLSVLLIEQDEMTVLLAVDALRDVAPLALGDPGEIVGESPLVMGTAQTGEGQVVLILSVDALIERMARHGRGAATGGGLVLPEPEVRRTILVVDDSITTRTLERGILEGQGYRVLLSVDGVDALDRLRTPGVAVDLIVADVEMPRMDGFALLAAIRNDPALAGIPVVMMTSRDAPDDIQRGLDLGADAYATKQSFEQGELLAIVRRLA